VIRAADRDRLREHLQSCGVETLVHWPKPLWEHNGLSLPNPHLPETEKICREVLSLPMSAEITPEQAEIVVDSVRSFFLSTPAGAVRAGTAS
jgi:dTDP-4-amino-4,6-dideoxygalactose transaminase